MYEDIKNEAEALSGRMSEWRRAFHRRPETANNEHETSAALKAFFERLLGPVKCVLFNSGAAGADKLKELLSSGR